jgi:hypothetical protein
MNIFNNSKLLFKKTYNGGRILLLTQLILILSLCCNAQSSKEQDYVQKMIDSFNSSQFAMNEKEVARIMEIQDSLPRTVFLDSTKLQGMQVYAGKNFQYWEPRNVFNYKIKELYDIRLKFQNSDTAQKFLNHYLDVLSNNGNEIKNHKLILNGCQNLRVFTGNDWYNHKMADIGFQTFIYLFLVDNYLIKVEILCDYKFQPNKFSSLLNLIPPKMRK